MFESKSGRDALDDYWEQNPMKGFQAFHAQNVQQCVVTVKLAVAYVQAQNIVIPGDQPSDDNIETRLHMAGFTKAQEQKVVNDKLIVKKDVMDKVIMDIVTWGWEGRQPLETHHIQPIINEEDRMPFKDPPLFVWSKNGGVHEDPYSPCDMWSYESPVKAIFDLVVINGLIALTVFEVLYSFAFFTDGGFSTTVSHVASWFFVIEIIMTLNQAYRDDTLLLHVQYKEIFKNYLVSWFIIDLLALIADATTGYALLQNSHGKLRKSDPDFPHDYTLRFWRLANLLRLLKLISMKRMKRLACALSGHQPKAKKPNLLVLIMQYVYAAAVWVMAIKLGVVSLQNYQKVQEQIEATGAKI